MVLSARSQIMRAAAAAASSAAASSAASAAAATASTGFSASSFPPPATPSSSPFSEILSASKAAQIDCPFTGAVMALLSDGVDGGHAQVRVCLCVVNHRYVLSSRFDLVCVHLCVK